VNPPDRPRSYAKRLVVLDEFYRRRLLGEFVETEDFREIPAVISDFSWPYFQRAFDIERSEFHFMPANSEQPAAGD